MIDIDNITIGEARKIASLFPNVAGAPASPATQPAHPMIGRRCIVRTYSAGVHIGTVQSVSGTEVHLVDALRLWSWTGGGLSLSAIARDGMKGGRVDRTGEIWLTQAIEFIPTTPEAEATYVKSIEK